MIRRFIEIVLKDRWLILVIVLLACSIAGAIIYDAHTNQPKGDKYSIDKIRKGF